MQETTTRTLPWPATSLSGLQVWGGKSRRKCVLFFTVLKESKYMVVQRAAAQHRLQDIRIYKRSQRCALRKVHCLALHCGKACGRLCSALC